MQGRPPRQRNGSRSVGGQSLLRWIGTILLLILAAIFGRDNFPGGGRVDRNAPFDSRISGAGRPIDGDSLYVGRDEVRLKGIDAPEGRQSCTRNGQTWACGEAAKRELVQIIGKDVVMCDVFERDQHGRLLARCNAGGRELNSGMVAAGMAVAYGDFTREEAAAKSARRGLWAGEFQRPRDWRDEHMRGAGG